MAEPAVAPPAWATLLLIGAARVVSARSLPMQLVLALATGVTVGASLLVAFGVPDRRMGAEGVAAALTAAGVPASGVSDQGVKAKGSRPFVAVTGAGQALFVKVLGSDDRDADLLYRAYRAVRLRGVGDTRPAASLFKAVEHEALVALWRSGPGSLSRTSARSSRPATGQSCWRWSWYLAGPWTSCPPTASPQAWPVKCGAR